VSRQRRFYPVRRLYFRFSAYQFHTANSIAFFVFISFAIIFGSLLDLAALILRTAPEFIWGTLKTTTPSNRFIGLQFLLCKADGL